MITLYDSVTLSTVGQVTQISAPVIVSRRCSVPSAEKLEIRITAAEATTKVIPMIASWGTGESSRRLKEKMRAPRSVKPKEKTYPIADPCSAPSMKATVAPRAAICASARSTKMTSRWMTCSPK